MKLQELVRRAVEPDLPEHLYDEEYDYLITMALEDFLEKLGRPDISEDVHCGITTIAEFRRDIHLFNPFMPDITIEDVTDRMYKRSVGKLIETIEKDKNDPFFSRTSICEETDGQFLAGLQNELYAQLAAEATKRAAARIPELLGDAKPMSEYDYERRKVLHMSLKDFRYESGDFKSAYLFGAKNVGKVLEELRASDCQEWLRLLEAQIEEVLDNRIYLKNWVAENAK